VIYTLRPNPRTQLCQFAAEFREILTLSVTRCCESVAEKWFIAATSVSLKGLGD